MPAAIIAAFLACGLTVLSTGSLDPAGTVAAVATGGVALCLTLWARASARPQPPLALMARAVGRWAHTAGLKAVWRTAFGPRHSHFVRLRRPAQALAGEAFAAALAATPGVQVVRIDADGVLVHVLAEQPDLLADLRRLDAPRREIASARTEKGAA